MIDAATKDKIQQEFLKPFVNGVSTTLETMANTSIGIESLKFVGDEDHFFGDVSGVMGLSGENGEGFVGITFDESLAKTLVARILGMEETELEEADIFDGVGEMVNMIAGSAKNSLLGTPWHFNLALPNVITGKKHEVGFRKDTPCWVTTMSSEGHTVYLLVAYQRK
jgi:chemotaxis protein CheX